MQSAVQNAVQNAECRMQKMPHYTHQKKQKHPRIEPRAGAGDWSEWSEWLDWSELNRIRGAYSRLPIAGSL